LEDVLAFELKEEMIGCQRTRWLDWFVGHGSGGDGGVGGFVFRHDDRFSDGSIADDRGSGGSGSSMMIFVS